MEKRLQMTVIEKETIFQSLEESLDRIHTLERHIREQDTKLEVIELNCFFWTISSNLLMNIYLNALQSTTKHLDRIQQENSSLNERLVSTDIQMYIRIAFTSL